MVTLAAIVAVEAWLARVRRRTKRHALTCRERRALDRLERGLERDEPTLAHQLRTMTIDDASPEHRTPTTRE